MQNPKRNVGNQTKSAGIKKENEEEIINPMFNKCKVVEQGEYDAIIQNVEEVRGDDNTDATFVEITFYIEQLDLVEKVKYMIPPVMTMNYGLARFHHFYGGYPEEDMPITAMIGNKGVFIKTYENVKKNM